MTQWYYPDFEVDFVRDYYDEIVELKSYEELRMDVATYEDYFP